MRFWITKNPKVALMLVPWFVPVTQTRNEIYLQLRERLTCTPEETFVCVAIEDDYIKGMVIAYCRFNDVFIWQASSATHGKHGTLRVYADMILNGVISWARSKGFHRISGWPNRAQELWRRRWGFVESETNKDEVYLEV